MKEKLKKWITFDRLVTIFIVAVIVVITIAVYSMVKGLSSDNTTSTPSIDEKNEIVSEQAVVYSDSGKKLRTYTNISNVDEGSNYIEFDYTTENYVVKHAKIYNSIIIME